MADVEVTKQLTYAANELDTTESVGGARRVSFVLEAGQPLAEVVVHADVVVNGKIEKAAPIRAADLTALTGAEKTQLGQLLKQVYGDRRDAVIADAPGAEQP